LRNGLRFALALVATSACHVPTVLPESGDLICEDFSGNAGRPSSPCSYAAYSANVYGRISCIEEVTEPVYSSNTSAVVDADRCFDDTLRPGRIFTLSDAEGFLVPVEGDVRIYSRRVDGFGDMEVGMAFGTGVVAGPDGLFVQSTTLFTFREDGTAVYQDGYCGYGRLDVNHRTELIRAFAQCQPNDAGTSERIAATCITQRAP
jgi:hypothetical protein